MNFKFQNLFTRLGGAFCAAWITFAWLADIHLLLAQTTVLSIAPAGNQVVLFWPSTTTNYVLQSTTNLLPDAWNAVSPVPLVLNGQNTVTNPIASTQQFYRLSLLTNPLGLALIPAGVFTMGDALDGESDATPTVSVTVSQFYIDVNLVSYSQWQSVYNWATNAGYGFDNVGSGKATNHPVQMVNWYDTVKWSNARSQQAGLTPVYYTDTGLTLVYTNGDVDAVYANWTANGYRLPTEAEWEKAARGELFGQRFPWGNTISESQANYDGCTTCYSYDLGPNGFNPIFATGIPDTSPVGYFPANNYGLYDMAGNVSEWCWDWYGTPYGEPTTTNPTGPASGSARVLRGGVWSGRAVVARCAYRYANLPMDVSSGFGFRCARSQPNSTPVSNMVLIPSGAFAMGDTLDGESDAMPTVSVTVSAFYMDTNLITYGQWQSVYKWATNAGYRFDYAGSGKATNHPVQTVDWYDAVKWSNARSKQAGLTPVYYTDINLTRLYTNGQATPYVNWTANGYRLPTEAEWEKASRGGLIGQRFPWGNWISWSLANYYGYPLSLSQNGYGFIYDYATAIGFDPAYTNGGAAYTSPVGSFAANGYGLYDMAGNVFEWCWDWYGTPYGEPTSTNPTGAASGTERVLRGGDWDSSAYDARCAGRYGYIPTWGGTGFGFRCVRGP